MERCAECGYVYGATPRADLAGAIRDQAGRYRPTLTGAEDPALRAHREPGVWSILEYSCHLRDVLAVQRERIGLALKDDEPDFTSMRREERVLEEGYNQQPPLAVAAELEDAADALAAALNGLDEAGWARTGLYHWPVTRVRSVEWIGQHSLHECVHHLKDISG